MCNGVSSLTHWPDLSGQRESESGQWVNEQTPLHIAQQHICQLSTTRTAKRYLGLMSAQPFGLLVCTPEAFYERGCQEKHLPTNRPPGGKDARGSQPGFR